jgi:hypothetical protein
MNATQVSVYVCDTELALWTMYIPQQKVTVVQDLDEAKLG